MTIWRDDVRQALEEIGGSGTLAEIYEAISHIRTELPKSWQAIVRRELEYNSSDSESYKEKYDLFLSVDGIGAGVWGLIPTSVAYNLCAQSRIPIDRMREGWFMSLFQASQQWVTMSS